MKLFSPPCFLAFLSLCILNPARAQILTFGDTEDDAILSAAYDHAGNIFYCGVFEGTGDGGGLAVQAGVVNVEDCRFTGNHADGSGGGGISTDYSELLANNCIVSMNTAPAAPDADNIAAIYNFIGGDPMLGPLRDNGGFVPTLALLTGSPAIDASPSSGGTGMDARLAPRNSGDRPDRGAFEYYEGSSAEEAISYSSWAQKLFSEDRDELADPNGDGISNLTAMYFGLYALGPNQGLGIDLRVNELEDFVVSYSVPIWVTRTTVTSSVVVADDLGSMDSPGPWSAAPASVELGSTTAKIDYELTLPTNSISRKFVMFEVSNGIP